MKCPLCGKHLATIRDLLRHRRVDRYNCHVPIPHACSCKTCDLVFQSWKGKLKHVQEVHAYERNDDRNESETQPIVPVSELWRSIPEQKSKTPPSDGESPQFQCEAVPEGDSASGGVVRGSWRSQREWVLTSRIPRSRCEQCRRWFNNKNDLRKHRKSTGHTTGLSAKLLSLREYWHLNGENDAETNVHVLDRTG